jgi:hypothetical protein
VGATQAYSKVDHDNDNDVGVTTDEANNNEVLDFGHAADPVNRRLISALIMNYYAAAVAEDGSKACSMLYITIAEAVPEDQGAGSAGPAYQSSGKTCAAVMALMFEHFREQLTAEFSHLKVIRVRLDKRRGVAVLSSSGLPERQILVLRERHTWKLEGLLDDELP